jgi:cytochrome P450
LTFLLGSQELRNNPIEGSITAQEFLEAFHDASRGAGMRVFLGALGAFLPRKRWLEACAKVHKFVHENIRMCHSQELSFSKNGPDIVNSAEHKSLLGNLVAQTNNLEEIRNQIIQGIMASQDTTSVLLSNTLFLLARNPATWESLRAAVLSSETMDWTFDTLHRFRPVRNIFLEGT